MLFTPEQIQIPMMNGTAQPVDVLSFRAMAPGSTLNVAFAVRRINDRLCYILHRETGLKVTGEHTGDMKEAAKGFADTVKVGAIDLHSIQQAASQSPKLNGVPS